MKKKIDVQSPHDGGISVAPEFDRSGEPPPLKADHSLDAEEDFYFQETKIPVSDLEIVDVRPLPAMSRDTQAKKD